MKPKIVAIIPARGGSKSIPRKNIRELGGYPLLSYSIAAGLQSKLVDRVIVSTDDWEIAEVARTFGAEVPFIRPASISGDYVTDIPVFEHALQWLEKEEGYQAEIIVQLRPTSPFRPPQCVDKAIEELLAHPGADSVRCVTPSGQNPYKMWRIDPMTHLLKPLLTGNFSEPYNMPRQKLPPTYWQTGIIEVIRRQTIVQKQSMTGKVILPYLIEPRYAVDLDTLLDWEFADFLLEKSDLEIVKPENQEDYVN